MAAKQIIGGDNLPCGFLAPSVGFWRDFQHVLTVISSLGELDDFPTEIQEGATAFRPIIFNPLLNRSLVFRGSPRYNKITA